MQSSLSAIEHDQQRAWRGWQISPIRLPGVAGDFCPHLFLARPNTIILMFNRMVQEKVVFISKKDLLREFHWQTKILLWKLWFSWSMLYTVVWLYNKGCGGYVAYCSIRSIVRIKQLQEFLKSDSWLRRNCIMSAGVFCFEAPRC